MTAGRKRMEPFFTEEQLNNMSRENLIEIMKIMKELQGQGKAMAFPPGVQPPSSKSRS